MGMDDREVGASANEDLVAVLKTCVCVRDSVVRLASAALPTT